MKEVFLLHGGKIQHYRIGVYNYLFGFLKKHNYVLTVVSEGKEPGIREQVEFPLIVLRFSFSSLMRLSSTQKPWVYIFFINHSEKYFFSFLLYLRLTGNKVITWTHGINLQNRSSLISRLAHNLEHSLCNRIILYSEQLKNHLSATHIKKAFVANNTLNLLSFKPELVQHSETLAKYGITTNKNIIYCGRIARRKKIEDLLAAFDLISKEDIGLILVGPDEDKTVGYQIKKNPRIFYLGPLYGNEALEILAASDVTCIPGAIGLGIVNAMYCGLPVVTEKVDHGPEIMYFKNGINGLMVEKGDIVSLAEKLKYLLENDDVRIEMGKKAREEILTKGHIENLCLGFLECLNSLRPDKEIKTATIKT